MMIANVDTLCDRANADADGSSRVLRPDEQLLLSRLKGSTVEIPDLRELLPPDWRVDPSPLFFDDARKLQAAVNPWLLRSAISPSLSVH